ncbi:MFS transporter [Granulosicoccaceae sp. 1_MG-2023]|nr:MFS transporter [Granulosicoccaceae sp. 1_MG-2023]
MALLIMRKTLLAAWPLFFGIALLMVGNGLQGTLLGWRASIESFSAQTTGLIMTGFYLGFLAGSRYTPGIITAVGHVRVFAALASVASTAILVQAVYVNPPVWLVGRIATGFCYAGLYIVIESWLNNSSTNETRGSVFSIYMVVTYISMAGGQWMLKLADPAGFHLFVMVSVLISLSLVPLLLSRTSAPQLEDSESVSVRQLFSWSPLGVVGTFGIGLAHSAVYAMGAVYASAAGMSVASTAIFMSMFILGGVFLQWPIGRLSDYFDRRKVLIVTTFLAALVSIALLNSGLSERQVFMLFGLYGGFSLPLYSLVIAHTNDRLRPGQMIAASSALIFLYGIGSSLGPLIIGFVLERVAPSGFFVFIAIMHLSVGVFGVGMMFKTAPVAADEQASVIPMGPRSTVVVAETVAQIMEEEVASNDDEADDEAESQQAGGK